MILTQDVQLPVREDAVHVIGVSWVTVYTADVAQATWWTVQDVDDRDIVMKFHPLRVIMVAGCTTSYLLLGGSFGLIAICLEGAGR